MTHKMMVTVKEPDEIGRLVDALSLDKETYNSYFEFGEYVTIEFELDEVLHVVSGRVVPLTEL